MSDTILQQAINRKMEQHGSLRAAGRAMRITAAYLSRLRGGKKCNPSDAVLRKLGVVRNVQVTYSWRVP